MRSFLVLSYFILEVVIFYLLATGLGVGKALLIFFSCVVGGLLLAVWQMRSITKKLAKGDNNAATLAGDIGLVAAGAVFLAIPGILSSMLGLIFVLPPTRFLIRRVLAKRLRFFIEDMGVRSFQATNSYRERVSYGSFAADNAPATDLSTAPPIVIDETEITKWSANVKPDDFKTNPSDQN